MSSSGSWASSVTLEQPKKAIDKRYSEVFFRALGLGLVHSTYRRLRGQWTGNETTKIALDQNRWLAALRCSVHILPVGSTIALTYLNFSSLYIGSEMQGLRNLDQFKFAILQIVAKCHELLINASLGTILLTYLRYHLTSGHGLPFGALQGRYSFTEPSYLWSIDFWAVFLSKIPFWRKVVLVGSMGFAVILAGFAAPSSAIAINPQLDWWHAGSSTYWLNASDTDMFPSVVDETFTGGTACTEPGAASMESCPAGGLASAKIYANQLVDRTATNTVPWIVSFGDPSSIRIMNVSASLGYYQLHYAYFSTATIPQLSVARSIGYMNHNWRDRMTERYQKFLKKAGDGFDGFRNAIFQVGSKQAITRVQCSDLKLRTLNDQSNLYFANQEDTGLPNTMTFFEPGLDFLSGVLDQNSSKSYPWTKTTFVTLPQEEFSTASIGAIVTLPKLANASSVWYTTCMIDARWADSNASTSIQPRIEQEVVGSMQALGDSYIYTEQSNLWPSSWQRITITEGWARSALLPVTNSISGQDAFQELAEIAGITGAYDSMAKNVIEALTAVWITSALSRIGNQATVVGKLKANLAWIGEWVRNGAIHDIDESSAMQRNWSKLRMNVFVQGYAYSMNGFTIRLAIAVLLTHVFLAICHTIYSVYTGSSSEAWETRAEMTALAVNSEPSRALENTCAGVRKLDTMKVIVKIVATGENEDHLSLRFTPNDEIEKKEAPSDEYISRKDGPVVTNKEYGTFS